MFPHSRCNNVRVLANLALVDGSTLPPEVAGTETVTTQLLGLQSRHLLLVGHRLEFRTSIERVFPGVTHRALGR